MAQVKLEKHNAAPPNIDITARVTWNSYFEKVAKSYRSQPQASTALLQWTRINETKTANVASWPHFFASPRLNLTTYSSID
jgi:hypothetical protein